MYKKLKDWNRKKGRWRNRRWQIHRNSNKNQIIDEIFLINKKRKTTNHIPSHSEAALCTPPSSLLSPNKQGKSKTTRRLTEKESESRKPNPRSRSKPRPTNNESPTRTRLATFSQTAGNSTERAQTRRSRTSFEPNPQYNQETPERTKTDGASSFPATANAIRRRTSGFPAEKRGFPTRRLENKKKGKKIGGREQ